MEALKLTTLADLLAHPDERVELIGGEIVHRPMARAEHDPGAGGSPPRSASSTSLISAPATPSPAGAENACPNAPAASWH
jgi:hypothetical protein